MLASTDHSAGQPGASKTSNVWLAMLAAWTVALAASAGALFLGEVMGQAPCLLCWYQRICMFPLALLLGIACFRSDGAAWVYALPLSLAGAAAAGYHILVYYGLVAESLQPCTRTGPSCSGGEMTLYGVVPLPVLSFAAFAVISLFLVIAARRSR